VFNRTDLYKMKESILENIKSKIYDHYPWSEIDSFKNLFLNHKPQKMINKSIDTNINSLNIMSLQTEKDEDEVISNKMSAVCGDSFANITDYSNSKLFKNPTLVQSIGKNKKLKNLMSQEELEVKGKQQM
jgi:hypothetical protein